MPQPTTDISPALAASQAEWKTAQSNDREGWLALMADDVVIEDPIGVSFANPDGNGLHGTEGAGTFYDTFIGTNKLTFTCEETFPTSSPNEIAHILSLRVGLPDGAASELRGLFTYRVNDAGLITNMRGYWTVDSVTSKGGLGSDQC